MGGGNTDPKSGVPGDSLGHSCQSPVMCVAAREQRVLAAGLL